MKPLLVLMVLLVCLPARAAEDAALDKLRGRSPEDAALERLRSEDLGEREKACVDLGKAEKRGPRVYPALALIMDRDISENVRLAAAKAVITFPGSEPLGRVEKFLQSEPGEQIRGDMLVALSTEPARLEDAEVTGLISRSLSDDPAAAVRRAAAGALARRRDVRATPAVRKAAENDVDKSVRAAAAEALRVLSIPRTPPKRIKIKKPEPKDDAVKGKDSCPSPYAWCECDGPIKRPPVCLKKKECRVEIDTMIQLGMPCTWNGNSIGLPGDD